jgi:hypothetical protein
MGVAKAKHCVVFILFFAINFFNAFFAIKYEKVVGISLRPYYMNSKGLV